ncbi:hypothetical protein NQ317_003137 [Molorchus minor]|uniref:Tubulin glycylase 3A n=1 Tax=Molorchus minor TaxID=1323400 RepID=A0ABQ9JM36_9CUCU|nr:hypothetical protein NQ317_003137 [Molorchus minor]
METKNDTNQEPDKKSIDVSSLVSSAPSSSKLRTVTSEIQKTIEDCSKRSTSVENKYRITITSERLAQLKKIVEDAIKNHKVFSIKGAGRMLIERKSLYVDGLQFCKGRIGGWSVVRRELLKRKWIEKVEYGNKKKFASIDEVTSNLPAKHDWESPQNYVDNMRKEPSDLQHRANAFKLTSRFSRSLYSSKEGLALLLQHSYWYTEAGVSNVNYPRVYVLGFPDHYNLFVDDFRITACMGLLKWFVEKYEKEDNLLKERYLTVPCSLRWTVVMITRQAKKHLDIDKDVTRIWDHEWDDFLYNYYTILHQCGLFLAFSEPLPQAYAKTKSTLKDITKYWPQSDIDGMRNIWILKPGNKCRGRGIQLVKHLSDVDKVMGLKVKYVVQKYIERPLIIYKTKFDIRQWFLITCVQPLTIWMYRECYLRFSSQIFSLDDFHESLHLTNHAVQCKYTNVQQRDKALPEDNMWDSFTFRAYLKQIGCMDKWNDVIFPGMQQSIICAMLASQDTMDRRQNTFELYGADFMVSDDYRPWLLEINCSPDLSYSTNVTRRLCPQCLEDLVKVVIDRRKDPNAETGSFQLVYKQNFPRIPAYLGLNLSVRGRRIFRNRSRTRVDKDKRDKDKEREKALIHARKHEYFKQEYIKKLPTINPNILPNTPKSYKGPVIEDLIEELHKSVGCSDVDSITVIRTTANKKNTELGIKTDRVANLSSYKHNVNKNKSFYRKENVKENIRNPYSSRISSSNSSCFGVLNEWSLRNEITSDIRKLSCENLWEKETASILKGTNILSTRSTDNGDINESNKSCFRSNCLATFDLNKLLPHVNCNHDNFDRIVN